MTNRQVAQAWRVGKKGHSMNMHTDGVIVNSYEYTIGYTAPDGAKVAICCHYSMTTAGKHCNQVKTAADRVEECSEHGRAYCHNPLSER